MPKAASKPSKPKAPGEGTVTAIDDAKLTIGFASRGTKQIIDYYVKRSKEE
jgi:hypothetical protein